MGPTCPGPQASSLLTSVPAPRADPSLCPGRFGSSYPGARFGAKGLYSVICQAVLPSPVCLCNYFCKNRILCGCHSHAPHLGPLCLPCLPAPHSAALGFPHLIPALAVRPSQQRPMTQQPAQSTRFWGVGVGVLLSRRFEPRALGKGTLHETPLPSLHQAKVQSSQTGLPLFMCQMAPSCVPHPLWSQSSLPLSPAVSVCLSSVPLCAVTAPKSRL